MGPLIYSQEVCINSTNGALFNSFFHISTVFLCVFCMSYLLWRAQDLANLEYGVYFAGAWEERSEGIKLCHDAANGPLVYV